MLKKREDWKRTISTYEAEHLVSVNENSVNINMSRIYGRAVGEKNK